MKKLYGLESHESKLTNNQRLMIDILNLNDDNKYEIINLEFSTNALHKEIDWLEPVEYACIVGRYYENKSAEHMAGLLNTNVVAINKNTEIAIGKLHNYRSYYNITHSQYRDSYKIDRDSTIENLLFYDKLVINLAKAGLKTVGDLEKLTVTQLDKISTYTEADRFYIEHRLSDELDIKDFKIKL